MASAWALWLVRADGPEQSTIEPTEEGVCAGRVADEDIARWERGAAPVTRVVEPASQLFLLRWGRRTASVPAVEEGDKGIARWKGVLGW